MTILLPWMLALSGVEGLAGDPAHAGAAYTRGLALLEEKKYDEAVAAFEQALRSEPAENPSLRYRDADGRHRHPYYPRYGMALARTLQAEREAAPYVRRERLQAAIALFGQTYFPLAAARREEAARQLEDLEKLIAENEANAVPPEISDLKTKVDRLCEAAAFEEAFAEIAKAAGALGKFPKVRDALVQSTRTRQRAVLRNYETILVSRLDSISRTDPTYEADVVLPLLTPARVPAEVIKEPEARFRWLNEFCDRYAKELDAVKTASTLEADRLLASSAAFDDLARAAAENTLFNGFRAARNMAHAMRMARLRELADTAEKPGSDLPGAADFKALVARILDATEASRVQAEELLAGLAAKNGPEADEARKYAAADLPYQKRQIEGTRGKIREVTTAYERRTAAQGVAVDAESKLLTPAIMGSPDECRKVSRALSAQESQVWFESLPAPIRARTLFTRAVSEATAALLEAEPANRVAERCRGDLLRALSLDGTVNKSWQGKLSPRLNALFERIRSE